MKRKPYKPLYEELPKNLQKDYGKELLGDIRDLEYPDTKKEQIIMDALRDWYEGWFMHGQDNDPKLILGLMKELLKLKRFAPEILNPDSNTLYRGIVKTLKETIGKNVSKDDFKKLDSTYYITKEQYNYKFSTPIQSWTDTPKSATEFLDDIKAFEDREGKVQIILKATFPKGSLLFNTEFSNVLAQEFIGGGQNEIIHISEKKDIKVHYIIKKEVYENIALSKEDIVKKAKFEKDTVFKLKNKNKKVKIVKVSVEGSNVKYVLKKIDKSGKLEKDNVIIWEDQIMALLNVGQLEEL